VTLTGQEPVYYTLTCSKKNITMDREDTANGSYTMDWESAGDGKVHHSDKHWDQHNYYLTSNVYPLVHAEIEGYDTDGSTAGPVKSRGLSHWTIKANISNSATSGTWAPNTKSR